jgi:NAD(P)-dependent dehydrogenase (short-subunit alcohol dehydrogenase family)
MGRLDGKVALGGGRHRRGRMTKAAARELGQFGIRVNSVHPGGVLTSMTLGQAGY